MIRRRSVPIAALAAAIAATGADAQQGATPAPREFTVASRDGTPIHGQADLAAPAPRVAVVMVAGTGLFDRDVRFGKSGTEGDRLFKDMAARFVRRGLAAIRYDRRGVNFGKTGAEMLDKPLSGSSTVESQRDDLAAIYGWARAKDGLGARCVILFGHSEGTLHIARLAASGAPEPLAVIGMGAAAASPAETVRWQMSERDAWSLAAMDADHDGRTTKAEVEAHWQETPSSVFDLLAPLLPPDGVAWTTEQIAQVRAAQAVLYAQAKAAALALDDAAPYPNAVTPMARSSWWKSWFTDETETASLLARWPHVPVYFHWGAKDSQTPPSLNLSPARTWLGSRATLTVHPGLGHNLGTHALFGPMDPGAADQIADQAAAAARQCR
ncbi:hypothetical protein [Sphingomonas sp. dw_22]|uniref:alpha/beta hydrolase n=1 Tax=Sphingomonas sp. dw_22 TaxID=2721175 RepID=UPI001BD64963|nr:hypothetical protein [Sphingomonas sp. dw_22]